jgi:ATP-binding cassette subfamily C protein CydC
MEQYDRILVLEKGKIVEQGLHGELMDGDGFYRRMWKLQHTIEMAG